MKVAARWSAFVLPVLVCSCRVFAQSCPLGEPSAENCILARVIDGSVGQHVVLVDAYGASATSQFDCGPPSGHLAWFEVVPQVTGVITISTCHPHTTYDTVLQVYYGGGIWCDNMSVVGCLDDSEGERCENGCSGFGSTLAVPAFAGDRIRFVVGSYNNNSPQCPLCLGVVVTIGDPCGEPPYGIACGVATPLPGSAGTHAIQIDAEDAPNGAEMWSCAPGVEKPQWLTFTPQVSGLARFSTCNPGTTFDTVVRVLTGNCAGVLIEQTCVDDSDEPGCDTSCNESTPRGSIAEFPITAGVDYYIEVAAFDGTPQMCPLCLDATLEIVDYCSQDTSPPLAEITSPIDLVCACDSLPIYGSALDPESRLSGYALEYRSLTGPWNLFASGTNPVSGALLGEWNTTGLTEGWYVIRLTATSICGLSSTAVRVVRVDKVFDELDLREPSAGVVLGGVACFDGSAWDECFDQYVVRYRPMGGSYAPVDPTHPSYRGVVLNDPLAEWDTIRLGLPDGAYETELAGTSTCGRQASESAVIVVDNTPSTAIITSPVNCDDVDGIVSVVGTAADANLASWALSFTGGNANGWVPIASGTQSVIGGTLAQWNTAGLPPCAYTLRLIVSDSAVVNCNGAIHHQTEYLTTVAIGWPGDFDWDNDGDVDLVDYQAFEAMFDGPNVP